MEMNKIYLDKVSKRLFQVREIIITEKQTLYRTYIIGYLDEHLVGFTGDTNKLNQRYLDEFCIQITGDNYLNYLKLDEEFGLIAKEIIVK